MLRDTTYLHTTICASAILVYFLPKAQEHKHYEATIYAFPITAEKPSKPTEFLVQPATIE